MTRFVQHLLSDQFSKEQIKHKQSVDIKNYTRSILKDQKSDAVESQISPIQRNQKKKSAERQRVTKRAPLCASKIALSHTFHQHERETFFLFRSPVKERKQSEERGRETLYTHSEAAAAFSPSLSLFLRAFFLFVNNKWREREIFHHSIKKRFRVHNSLIVRPSWRRRL